MLSREPWDPHARGRARSRGEQPDYRLSNIAGGTFEAYLMTYAQGIAALPYGVAVRFAHEMNGFWYPWCEQSNANAPGDYVRAFRHVHDVFVAQHATNVTWVWSPNVGYDGSAPLPALYPGDDVVDWVGLSGYFGDPDVGFRTFRDIFGPSLSLGALRTITARPIVVTEVAASDQTGRKADWITGMFEDLLREPDVIGIVWFEVRKEVDWRVTASAAERTGSGGVCGTKVAYGNSCAGGHGAYREARSSTAGRRADPRRGRGTGAHVKDPVGVRAPTRVPDAADRSACLSHPATRLSVDLWDELACP